MARSRFLRQVEHKIIKEAYIKNGELMFKLDTGETIGVYFDDEDETLEGYLFNKEGYQSGVSVGGTLSERGEVEEGKTLGEA